MIKKNWKKWGLTDPTQQIIKSTNKKKIKSENKTRLSWLVNAMKVIINAKKLQSGDHKSSTSTHFVNDSKLRSDYVKICN